ncbi:hypothetical protein APR47_09585, partial [Variovorax paradoxus]|uniref:hypothetical protein n=1 Tax=Variovorax paradoxus TaxID=34073 RepID=UPI0006E5863E
GPEELVARERHHHRGHAGTRLTAQDLARGIAWTDDEAVRSRARELGERMRAEQGLARAVAFIEATLAR